MSKPDIYCQCKLEMVTDSGTRVDIRWVPLHLAVIGKILEVKYKDGIETTQNGRWKVVETGENWPAERLQAYSHDYMAQYTVSDAHRDPHTGKWITPQKPKG